MKISEVKIFMNFILASTKSWHAEFFAQNRQSLVGNWSFVTCLSDLEVQASQLDPTFIFFLHWSEIVPARVHEKYNCVCFHMTDLPYGRGGSPLQNLIVSGHTITSISAIKMVGEIDAGPVYLKRNLDLTGTALEIFKRATPICFLNDQEIQNADLEPVVQQGDPTYFRRRTAADSKILKTITIDQMYDLIRMLDAPDYPKAFIHHGKFKLEFSDASFVGDGTLNAKVKISQDEK